MKRLFMMLTIIATACQTATPGKLVIAPHTLRDIPVDITPVFPAAGEK